MDRVLQGTAQAATVTIQSGGTPTDADAVVLVSALRADGTVLFAATAAQHTGVGLYQTPLSAAQTALLDNLTLTWSFTLAGSAQSLKTRVEIVGGYLFSVADLRKRLPDTTLYPTSALVDARTAAEQDLEEACGISFVPRYEKDTFTVRMPTDELVLSRNHIRTLRGVIVDGVSLSAPDLAYLALEPESGILRRYTPSWWGTQISSTFQSSVIVGYEHGEDSVPEFIRRAALDLATEIAPQDAGGSAAIDSRASKIVTQDGTLELSLRGSPGDYGIPSVDAAVARYGLPGIA